MHDSLISDLKGCVVFVTADGENFRRTRIAEITPSGRYVRLESDEPTPGGIQRWRTFASLQMLETYTASIGFPVMHGIIRLKKSPGPHCPTVSIPHIDSACAAAPNVLAFPFPASSKIDSACIPPVRAALSP